MHQNREGKGKGVRGDELQSDRVAENYVQGERYGGGLQSTRPSGGLWEVGGVRDIKFS